MSNAEISAVARQRDPQPLHLDADHATAIHGSLISSGLQTMLHVFEPILRELFVTRANIGGLGFDNLRWTPPCVLMSRMP